MEVTTMDRKYMCEIEVEVIKAIAQLKVLKTKMFYNRDSDRQYQNLSEDLGPMVDMLNDIRGKS
jgi:hypothetical protein